MNRRNRAGPHLAVKRRLWKLTLHLTYRRRPTDLLQHSGKPGRIRAGKSTSIQPGVSVRSARFAPGTRTQRIAALVTDQMRVGHTSTARVSAGFAALAKSMRQRLS